MAGQFIQRSRHGTVFYFRRRVPNDLRGKVGRAHIYISLRTEELVRARRMARVLAVATDQLFLHLRYGHDRSGVLSTGPLSSDKGGDANSRVVATNSSEKTEFQRRTTNNWIVDIQSSDDMNLATNSLCLDYGLTFEFDSRGNPKITVTDAKPGDEAAIEDAAKRVVALAKPSAAPEPTSPTPTVAEAIQAVLASPDIKPNTVKEYRRAFGFFAAFVGGETRLGDIQAERFAQFADHVRAQTKWAAKTQGFYITSAQRLFTFYASRCSAVPRITTTGLKPRRSAPESLDRAAYTIEQLETVFRAAASYRSSELAKWWVTVASAFMGTRVEELCQAHLDGDFQLDAGSGIYYLQIDEVTRGVVPYAKSVKTQAGWRKVPIHPCLVRAGFIRFLELERNAGSSTPFQRCWAPLTGGVDARIKHSHYVARWGSKTVERLRSEGVLPEKVSYFHSMRHTFSTLLSKADIGEEWRAALCGQTYGGINAKVYDKAKHDVSVTLPKVTTGLQPLEAMFERVLEDARRQPNEGTW